LPPRELRLAHRLELLLRGVVPVGETLREKLLPDLAIAREALHLEERPLVPVELEPLHRVEDGLLRFLRRALEVGVLDAQDELAAVAARVGPVEERRAGAPEVEIPGGARREAGADHGARKARRKNVHSTFAAVPGAAS